MTPRRALVLGLALGALAPFAAFGLAGAVLLALTQPPFLAFFGIDRWAVHPWLSLTGAAAAMWPLAVGATAALILGLRAAGAPAFAAAALAAAASWAGLAIAMAALAAGGVAQPLFAETLQDAALLWAAPALLSATALDLGPRLVRRLARERLAPEADGGYRAPANAGRTP